MVPALMELTVSGNKHFKKMLIYPVITVVTAKKERYKWLRKHKLGGPSWEWGSGKMSS